MRKINNNFFLISIISILIFSSVVCFASPSSVPPDPKGSASIKENLSGIPISIPSIDRVPNTFGPLPTNKWFTSLIHANTISEQRAALAMYTYPLVYTISKTTGGLIIGCPNLNASDKTFTFASSVNETEPFRNQLTILPYSNSTVQNISLDKIKLDDFSDWSCTIDNSYYKAIIGQGMLFSYFDFTQQSCDAAINFTNANNTTFTVYKCDDSDDSNWKYEPVINDSFKTDKFVIEVNISSYPVWTGFQDRKVSSTSCYGVFLSSSATNVESSSSGVKINFTDNNNRYMSIALMTSKEDLKSFYPYAYNFVKKTEAKTSIENNTVKTSFEFTFDNKGKNKNSIKNQTIFALMPHHYKNNKNKISINFFGNRTFQTLRGKMKVAVGNSFTTVYDTLSIVPFFQYDISDIKDNLVNYLEKEKDLPIAPSQQQEPYHKDDDNTYYYGKNLAKIANLIPIADNLKKVDSKNLLIDKLKDELSVWFKYKGQSKRYFAYDNTWGGLMGVGDPSLFINGKSFGTEQYNDHHFHYGYFIYASAILAMYDEDFKNNYGGMVELLIKDIANLDRDNPNFPFMRNFDIYEGHSWASGMGGTETADGGGNIYSDSINEESSSEAMNAWSAIYMWGLATNNQEYIDLGLKLYTIHYNSLKEYYLDVDADTGKDSDRIYLKKYMDGKYGGYGSVGILFGGRASYSVWWNTTNTREIKGIQVLPLTSSMSSYWSYDSEYTEKFYNKIDKNQLKWNDIWSRLQALYNPAEAFETFTKDNTKINWEDWDKASEIDDGGTVTFTYHFINFFKKYGKPIFNKYSCDVPSYMVLNNNGTETYCVYNYDNNSKNIHFYSKGEDLGYLNVAGKSFLTAQKLIKNGPKDKISVFPVPYKPNSNSKYGGEGINFAGLKNGANIKIFNIAGEKVFDKTVSADNGTFIWNAKNNAGNNVASGIYIYIVDSDGKKTKGKLAIER